MLDKAQEYHLFDGSGTAFKPRLELYKPEYISALTPYQARGIVWIFSEPRSDRRYVLCADPTYGIPGWHPGLASEVDEKIDNAAGSVWQVGPNSMEQVAEYAGPVEPAVFARILNGLGRLYKGNDSLGMCRLIMESWPGPGTTVEQELLGSYHYWNYWTPKPIQGMEGVGTGLSWRADVQSNKNISINARKVVNKKKVIIRSPWLAEEMQDAVIDNDGNRWVIRVPEDSENLHDDRLRAAMIGWWLIYGTEIDTSMPPPEVSKTVLQVQKGPRLDWQNTDCSVDKMKQQWEQKWWEISRPR